MSFADSVVAVETAFFKVPSSGVGELCRFQIRFSGNLIWGARSPLGSLNQFLCEDFYAHLHRREPGNTRVFMGRFLASEKLDTPVSNYSATLRLRSDVVTVSCSRRRRASLPAYSVVSVTH